MLRRSVIHMPHIQYSQPGRAASVASSHVVVLNLRAAAVPVPAAEARKTHKTSYPSNARQKHNKSMEPRRSEQSEQQDLIPEDYFVPMGHCPCRTTVEHSEGVAEGAARQGWIALQGAWEVQDVRLLNRSLVLLNYARRVFASAHGCYGQRLSQHKPVIIKPSKLCLNSIH